MVAPVFSRAPGVVLENDPARLLCTGDPTKNIGIVGVPTLGSLAESKKDGEAETRGLATHTMDLSSSEQQVPSLSHQPTGRDEVRNRSYVEFEIFKNRWKNAVKDDDCWIDIFKQSQKHRKH